jgi:tricorn protease-like protein
VRDLREDVGNLALVVGEKGDRILFQEKDDRWHTCDLNGGDVKMVGKGLIKLGFPSASPDGKRVIMIEHDENERTWPVVVDLATGEVKKAKAEEGRWILPIWK